MKRKALRIPGLPFGLLAIAAGVAMLIGDVFDKGFFGGDRAQMYEEYFETVGYFLLLTAALSAGSLSRISAQAPLSQRPVSLIKITDQIAGAGRGRLR